MNRLTNNDRNLGPFTLGRWKHRFSLEWSSGGGNDDDDYRNQLLIVGFGWALRVALPNILRPYREKHIAESWDEETIARMGRNWYYKNYSREFGISLCDMGNGYDFIQLHYGAQTHDSDTTKIWCKHLPWKQWKCVRNSVYRPDGSHYSTKPSKRGAFVEWMKERDACPTSKFSFEDYDGEIIVATCTIEEREWHRGEGWFEWLKWFWPAKIRRSLDLKFSAEVGPEKGSWKGGTIGHGIEMLPNETAEQAFMRYCAKEHSARGNRNFRVRYIGLL